MQDDDDLRLRDALASWARRHWLFVASLVALLGLLLVPSVWRLQVEVNRRNGMSSRVPLGERGLWMSAIGVAFYLLAGLGGLHSWRMRAPTDGERAVARWLLRAFGLGILWAAFYVTLP
jgi:hypothetical protein